MSDPVARLTGVHPHLVGKVMRILAAMRELGLEMLVTDGVRTAEQQAELYAKGRTVPGRIVTHADGVTKRSNHQIWADGYGHAVDLVFLVNGSPSWDEMLPWSLYGAMVRQQALKWGGDFTTIRDLPHAELS